MRERVAHQRPAFECDKTRKQPADAADQGADVNRFGHVVITKRQADLLPNVDPAHRRVSDFFLIKSVSPECNCPSRSSSSGRSSSLITIILFCPPASGASV